MYSQYLDIEAQTYGKANNVNGVAMRYQPGTQYPATTNRVIYTVPHNTTMLYAWTITVEQALWFRCVSGITHG